MKATNHQDNGFFCTFDATRVLLACYRERAGEEALLRAMLAERDLKVTQAHFCMRVYDRLRPGSKSPRTS